jgi:hypothetical protein
MLSKAKQTTDISRAHAALLVEATKLGWPTHFATDLDHDARAIATMAPHEPFAWAIGAHGAHGTHIGRSGDQLTMCEVSDSFTDCRFYVWDGYHLHETPTASDADSRLARVADRRYEIRCARRTASYWAATESESREIQRDAELRLGEAFVVRDTWEGK